MAARTPRPAAADPDFPAFRAFARGYLHEDYVQEHGTVRGALEAFRRDAQPHERRTLAREWAALADRLERRSAAASPDALVQDLGSAWAPANAQEFRDALAALQPDLRGGTSAAPSPRARRRPARNKS